MSVPRETQPFEPPGIPHRRVYGMPQAGWACAWCGDPRRHLHEIRADGQQPRPSRGSVDGVRPGTAAGDFDWLALDKLRRGAGY